MKNVITYPTHYTSADIERFNSYAYGGFGDFKTIIDIASDYVREHPECYCHELLIVLKDAIRSDDEGFIRGVTNVAVDILSNHTANNVYFKFDGDSLRLYSILP